MKTHLGKRERTNTVSLHISVPVQREMSRQAYVFYIMLCCAMLYCCSTHVFDCSQPFI